MVRNIITDLCHHLEIGIDGNLDIGNKRVIVGTPTITLTDNILTISCDTAGANIYYTLDGSTPTSASTRYTTAVTLSNSCTIKAIAIKGSKSSMVVSQDYVAILTAWRLIGNSEVHGNEIWSCGEYNPIDGKYHILVQSQGGNIADIALTEPLRKANDVADTIEFPVALEAFTDADGNQIATTLPDDTILHIQNLYNYTQTTRHNVTANNISQRNAEIKIISLSSASYLGFGMPLQGGEYYSSCLFKNEDANPNIIYSNSGNSSTVSSSDYQKISLLKSGVTTCRYSALNNPAGVWELNDVFFVKDINIFDIDVMFADCTDLKPTSASDFEALFPNLGCIDKTNTAIDVIVKDGKLYKYVETEGKALVTRNIGTTIVAYNGIFNADTYGTWYYDKALSNVLQDNDSVITKNNLFSDVSMTNRGVATTAPPRIFITGSRICFRGTIWQQQGGSITDLTDYLQELHDNGVDMCVLYLLATPTTELVDAPQIEEAESYSMVISQGTKAVEWTEFIANPT